MDSYQQELLENIIRNARHGLACAEKEQSDLVDFFHQILDEAARLKKGTKK